MRPHGVDAWVFHYTLAGAARFFHTRGSFEAHPGDLVLISPGTPQHYGTEGAVTWEPLWAVFSDQPHWHHLLTWPEEGPGHFVLHMQGKPLKEQVESKLWDMIKLIAEVPRHRGALGLNALEAALLWCTLETSSPGMSPWDARLQRAVSYVYQNYGQAFSMDTLAAASGASVPHLTRLFRQTLKTSPGRFIEGVRMDRARELLAYTSMSVQAIAWNIGFENPFYFTNRFRKSVGMSPRAYRQKLLAPR